jgi:hypothetical protein
VIVPGVRAGPSERAEPSKWITMCARRSGAPAPDYGIYKATILNSAVQTASLDGKTATGGRLDANGALAR